MIEKYVISICKLLSEAGQRILNVYNSGDFVPSIKADLSPVTQADKQSSKIINDGLQQIFPGVNVIDEEKSIPELEIRNKWDRYFLIDPLDGTKEFIKKNGEFCINLAVIKNNLPVEGWIYQPLEKKGWYSKKGQGIFEFDGFGNLSKIESIQNNCTEICIVASRSFFKPREAEIIKQIEKNYAVKVIHKGSSLKQISMVLGKADLYIKAGPCSEWDTAPGQLMIDEIGGATLMMENFEPMKYNKKEMMNPFFVMISSRLNTPEFIMFLKKVIKNL